MSDNRTSALDELDELQRDLDAGVIHAGSDEHRARLAVVAALEAPMAERAPLLESAAAAPATATARSLVGRKRPAARPDRAARPFLPRFALPKADELLAGTVVTILVVALVMIAGGRSEDVPTATGAEAAAVLKPVVPPVIESCDVNGAGAWGPITATATAAAVAVRWTKAIDSLESEPPFVVVVAFDRAGVSPASSGSAVDRLGSRQLWFAWDGKFATTSIRTLTPTGWDAAPSGPDVTTRLFARGFDFGIAGEAPPRAAVFCD